MTREQLDYYRPRCPELADEVIILLAQLRTAGEQVETANRNHDDLRGNCARVVTENERLRAALEPFAKHAAVYDVWGRCGGAKGFCTRADFDRATKDAAALAARLGDGWTPCVWENLGWHWEVQKGALVIADRFDAGGMIVRGSLGKYTAEFRSVENGASAIMQFFADASTPEEAIGQVRQDVRTYISRVEADLADSI